MVQKVMNTDPSMYGYWAEGWTLGLLRHHLKTTQDVEVSEATVRRSLRGIGYQWKRPRYVLAYRDPHGRQAKGAEARTERENSDGGPFHRCHHHY